jgi:hypothetical protein
VSSSNQVRPNANVVNTLVGNVVRGIASNDSRKESPGSEGTGGESVDILRTLRVDALGQGDGSVVLDGVEHRNCGNLDRRDIRVRN